MKLRNKSRQTQIVTLPHDVVCTSDLCLCETKEFRQVEHNAKTGEKGVRNTERLICRSVHLLPGTMSEDLPETVEQVITDRRFARALEICA